MINVLSFDGGQTTGWAYQDERDDFPGGIKDFGQLEGIPALWDFLGKWNLEKRPVNCVVYEEYKVWGGNKGAKANVGQNVIAEQANGIIIGWAASHNLPIAFYNSSDLDHYAKKTGLNPRIGAHKNTHWAFAAVYGRQWLQEHKYAKTALQRAMQK